MLKFSYTNPIYEGLAFVITVTYASGIHCLGVKYSEYSVKMNVKLYNKKVIYSC